MVLSGARLVSKVAVFFSTRATFTLVGNCFSLETSLDSLVFVFAVTDNTAPPLGLLVFISRFFFKEQAQLGIDLVIQIHGDAAMERKDGEGY